MKSEPGTISSIGRLRRVSLRAVWPREDADFTPWLQKNLKVLNEHLEVNLRSAKREQSVGNFNVDLLAKDFNGQTVVIENQLDRTNHDHLGKLITYLAAVGAVRAIWITSDPRPEHVEAVSWLNDTTEADFHLFLMEVVRVDDSLPAPLLTQIVGPSADGKRVAARKKVAGRKKVAVRKKGGKARQRALLAYWTRLLELASDRTKLFSGVVPRTHGILQIPGGVAGLVYRLVVKKNSASIVLAIDRGPGKDRLNRAIFRQLKKSQENIEESCPGSWTWDLMEGLRASKIVLELEESVGWADDSDDWDAPMKLLIDAIISFEAALRPHIAALDMKA